MRWEFHRSWLKPENRCLVPAQQLGGVRVEVKSSPLRLGLHAKTLTAQATVCTESARKANQS